MGGPRSPLLLLLLGVAMVADHVTGQGLQLSPSRTEHVTFADKSLYVSCKGQNPVEMVWYGPSGKPIVVQTGPVRVAPSLAKDGLKGLELFLNPVKRKDSGTYRCEAYINGRREEVSFDLVVLQPIRFLETQKLQFAPEGEDFVLLCDVTGEPKPQVAWRGVAQPLEIGPDKKYDIDPKTKGLLIRDVTRQDEGKYRCKATQVNKKDSDLRETDIELRVQYKPEWTGLQQSEVYGFLGGSANLSCQADAKPSPDFVWHRGDQEIIQGDEHFEPVTTEYRSVLQISSLDDSMFGEYRCEAKNQYDSITHTIVLRKGQKPAVPQVKVTKTESSQLTLSITVAPEEDPADMYRAEYRTEQAAWSSATAVEFQPGGSHIISNLQPDTTYVIRVAALNQAGRGDFSPGLRQRTAARRAGDDPSASSSQPLVLSLFVSLLMAALLVL